jgi:small subunit ribosomal protein S17
MPKRQLIGTIKSTKMAKTVVVEVEKIKAHPKYKRRYKYHKRYKAHVDEEAYQAGDRVIIEECRPFSKDKRWKVVKRLTTKIGEESGESTDAPA